MTNLPINEVLPKLQRTLKIENRLILQAPPGAGKSTRIPLALLDSPWLEDKIIIMLEPRRVAARMVATQMAKLLGEELGQRVGYQVKMESLYSAKTKILVVTEAILVRMLQSDQSLQSVALIIFDEFHERSIHSDLSLALSLQVQELLRDDLKILIMSATLNAVKLTKLLGDVPVITSEGKSFHIAYHYLDIKTPQPDFRRMNGLLQKTILNAVEKDEGDILVFLQGVREIKKLQTSLNELLSSSKISVLPLYSALSKKEQDRALFPSKQKKIILATNIAQTSLTIEGVRVVIDSGLEKLSRFNHATGMNHLESAFISKDSATQRAGRAGRVSDGKCYRLWHEHKPLIESTKAEILRSDLSSLVLDLALWGVEDFEELLWLDIPPESSLLSIKTLLQELQMLDSKFKITEFGRNAISLGVHPRFAYMILRAEAMGYAYEATLLSALLSEQSILKDAHNESDILPAFNHLRQRDLDARYIHLFKAKEVLKQADYFYSKLKKIKKLSEQKQAFEKSILAVLLLLAYPDRLAQRRGKNDKRYKLSNGKGAIIHQEDSLFNEEYLVVANVNAQAKESFIHQALSISLSEIEEYFCEYITSEESVTYKAETKSFEIREISRFLALELSSKPLQINKKHNIKKLLLNLIKQEGLGILHWSKKASSLRERVAFVNANREKKMKSLSDKSLLVSLESWLAPFMCGVKSVKELESLELYPFLLASLSWEEQQKLEKLAPQSVQVPSGSNIHIDYSDIQKPKIAVKIQEMFGLEETPKILNATTPLQIHLLSPAMRPIQITYDISSFWKNSYGEVRKELRGKYKRHYWPEDPYEAVATKKTKKHMMD